MKPGKPRPYTVNRAVIYRLLIFLACCAAVFYAGIRRAFYGRWFDLPAATGKTLVEPGA